MALITCTTARFTCPEQEKVRKGHRAHTWPSAMPAPTSICAPHLCPHLYQCSCPYTTTPQLSLQLHLHLDSDTLIWIATPTPGPTPAVVPNTWLYRSLLSPGLAAFEPPCNICSSQKKASFPATPHTFSPSSQLLRRYLISPTAFFHALLPNFILKAMKTALLKICSKSPCPPGLPSPPYIHSILVSNRPVLSALFIWP